MLLKRCFPVIYTLFFGLGCNSVKFQGGAANKVTPQQEVSFTCEAKPKTIELGKEIDISITASIPYDLPVYQTIVNGDQKNASTLKFSDDAYKREDGSPNRIKPDKQGSHSVELRSTPDGPIKGKCDFEVKPKQCQPNEQLVGANVAFIIDNSFSHATTDCAGFDQNLWANEQRVICRQPTNRENAVLAAFDTLEKVSKSRDYDERSKSHLAIVSFPTRQNFVGGGAIRTQQGWIETVANSRASLAEGLQFSRQPVGYTPYGGGLIQAKTLFGSGFATDNNKPKIAVLVTDGEPTDQNPKATLKLANELRESGVKIITVYVLDGKARKDRRQEHVSFLADENRIWENQRGRSWFDDGEYNSFDNYLADLMGQSPNQPDLITQISSKKDESCEDKADATCDRTLLEVDNSQGLMEAFKGLVLEATTCE